MAKKNVSIRVLLRYRNLIAHTVEEHRKVIESSKEKVTDYIDDGKDAFGQEFFQPLDPCLFLNGRLEAALFGEAAEFFHVQAMLRQIASAS